MPSADKTKYLDLTQNVKLTWKKHFIEKSDLKYKLHQYYWLLGKNFQLPINNKILIYKQILNRFGYMASNFGDVSKK